MRLSRNHVDYVAFLVYKALKDHPNLELKDPDAAIAAVRMELLANLQAEDELEKEAERMLAPHRTQILQSGADYQKMVREGMQTLAKKRGIVV